MSASVNDKEARSVSIQNDVHKAVERALKDNHKLREVTVEEVTHQLVLGGYLQEELPASLIADTLGTMAAEEQAFAPGIRVRRMYSGITSIHPIV